MHLGLAQKVKRLHDLFVGGFLALGHAVMIVQLARSIEAETDIKVFFAEKLAPLVVDGGAVG